MKLVKGCRWGVVRPKSLNTPVPCWPPHAAPQLRAERGRAGRLRPGEQLRGSPLPDPAKLGFR